MKKKIIVLVLPLLMGAFTAFGQEEVSQEYRQALGTLMEVNNSQATFRAVINQTVEGFKEQKREVPAEIWEELRHELLGTSIDELLDMIAPVYARHITLEELQDIIAFYESPAGKKLAEKTPLITQESMQIGQQWGRKVGERVIDKLSEEGF